MSGLICLDWYDWNPQNLSPHVLSSTSGRDWSVWIDTIETGLLLPPWHRRHHVGIDLSELIRLKLLTFRQIDSCPMVGIDLFGLIRLKLLLVTGGHIIHLNVGINLSWLIRLKLVGSRNSYVSVIWVGIDLSWLIRLKPLPGTKVGVVTMSSSGLICLDWYDWNEWFQ